jgi:hypothetical protein
MDSTIAGSMNDNINMDSTIAGSMNDNINMDSTNGKYPLSFEWIYIMENIHCHLNGYT